MTRTYIRESELPRVSVSSLESLVQEAIARALAVRNNAYPPYSNDYKVGAAVISITGQIYTGVNVENCAFKVPHAEENALCEMAKNGERQFTILICVAKNGGVPCLSCRQFMREFSGPDLDAVTVVGVAVEDPTLATVCTFGRLVGVDSFGPEDLDVDPSKH
jgi:cytidine deaminase